MKKLFISFLLLCICIFVCTTALAADYMFTSTITEEHNQLTVKLNVSESVQGNYFMLNAYKGNKMVANEIIKVNFAFGSTTINCSDKPDDVKVSVWDSLSSIKPLVDYVDFDATVKDGVQIFSPTNGFPEDFYTIEGFFTGNEKTFVDSPSSMAKDYINIRGYDRPANDYFIIYAPDIDLDYYLGKAVSVAYTETDTGRVFKSIRELKSNSVAKIEDTSYIMANGSWKYASDFHYDDSYNGLTGYISVYNEEVDLTNTEYRLDGANIVYNGQWVSAENFTFPAMGSAELLDNDGDGKYEVIFVTEYKTYVVDSVFDKKIGMKVGTTLDLTAFIEGKEGYHYSLTLDGKKIDVSDLKEYDVLSVAASSNWKNVDILVSRNVVEGAVEAIEVSTNPYKTIYTIASKEYTISNNVGGRVPSIKITSEGKFYIDYFGKIAYWEAPSVLETGTLAFIRRAGSYPSNWDASKTEYEIELINKDGSIGIYNIAENVSVKLNNKYAYITGTTVTAYDYNTPVAKQTKDAVGAALLALAPSTPVEANAGARVITYKTNSANEIVSITFATYGQGEGLKYSLLTTQEYDADVAALGQVGITENTTVFYVPHPQTGIPHTANYTYEDYKVVPSTFLKNNTKYNYAYLDRNDTNNVSVLVITYADTYIPDNANLAVITASRQVNDEDGNSAIEIDIVQGGEKATLRVDTYVSDSWTNLTTLSRGAYLDYAVNAEGNIDKAVAVTMATVKNKATGLVTPYPTFKADSVAAKSYYIGGYVVGKNGSILTLNTEFTTTTGNRVAIPDSANIYMIDASQAKITLQKTTIGDISKCQYYIDGLGNYRLEKDCDTYVVIKYSDNTISDVLVYSNLSYFEGLAPLVTVMSSEINSDNCIEVTFTEYKNSKTLALSKDCKYNTPENNVFTKGSSFRYSVNEDGEICDIYDESFIVPFDIYKNLAYIQAFSAYPSNWDCSKTECEIQLLNKDGSVKVYNLANTIIISKDNMLMKYYESNAADLIYECMYSNAADRIISYRTNSKGEITYIVFSDAGTDEGLNYVSFTEEYDTSVNGFASASINDDAIVFYIPAYGTKDEYEICSPSIFEDGTTYSVSIFALDENYYGNIAVITSTIDVECSDSLATVISSTVTEDKELMITFEQDGETKTLSVAKNCDYYIPDNNPFTEGTTFRYTLNLKGEMFEIYDENFIPDPTAYKNIAFICALGSYPSQWDWSKEEYEMQLLNKDGSISVYSLADSIMVSNNETTMGKTAKYAVAQMIKDKIHYANNSATDYANRIISYKVNAKGKITSITFPDNNSSEGLSVTPGSEWPVEYDASVSALDYYCVTDDTIIFYLPPYEGIDGFRIIDSSYLRDGNEYLAAYLDIDENHNAGIIVITEAGYSLGNDSLAITTGTKITVNEAGDQVVQVSFLQDGEVKTLLVDTNSYINELSNFPRGSAFEYSLNLDGYIDDAIFCGFGQYGPLSFSGVKALAYDGQIPTKKEGNKDFEYIGGYVVGKSGSVLTLANSFYAATGDRVAIPETANIYTIDVTKSKIVPQVASIGDIVKCQYYVNGDYTYAEEDANTYVLIKYIDDKIVDVIAYNGFDL